MAKIVHIDDEDLIAIAKPEQGDIASTSVPVRQGWRAWLQAHPWTLALVVLCVAAIVAAMVLLPLCLTKGCPPRSSGVGEDSGLPRLLVNYFNVSIDVMSLLPAILRPYASNLHLDSSSISVLSFDSEDVLQKAMQYLANEPSLNFLTRDFVMNFIPNATDISALPGAANDSLLQWIVRQLPISTWLANLGSWLPWGPLLQDSLADEGASSLANFSVNDPYYTNGSQYYIDLVNATGAWSFQAGSPNVVVAIVDSGVYLDHPDIQSSLWVNAGEVPDDGIDNDGNGYIDDVYGYNFAGQCTSWSSGVCTQCGGTAMPYPESDVDPKYYHGTHVAGLVGGVQNNDEGISGTGASVKIMVLRVSDCIDGTIAASTVFQAFDYAYKMGAHIVSTSIGSTYAYGFNPTTPAPSYHAQWTASYVTALKPLADKGVLAVVAAGNDNIDLDNLAALGWAYTPCLVNLSNIVCVGGTDPLDQLASFSNYGTSSVHIGSPSIQMYSTLYQNASGSPTPTYGPLNGTSMGTPVVSGSAALTLSILGAQDGNYFKATQAKSILMASGDRPSSAQLPFVSQARVNAGRAIWQAASTLLKPVSLAPVYGTASTLPAIMYFQGMAQNYYAPAARLPSTPLGPPFDTSVFNVSRASNQPVNLTAASFKNSTGVTVSLTALLRLNIVGLWGVCVEAPGALATTWVFMNGVQVPLNASSQTGVFSTTAPGLFSFELRIGSPSASPTYRLSFRSPRASAFSSYYSFLTPGPATSSAAAYSQSNSVLDAWQVSFYRTNATSNLSAQLAAVSVASVSATAAQNVTTAVLQDPTGSGLPALLAAAAPAAASVGYLQTFLLPTEQWMLPVAFKVSCMGCQLLVDGAVVVDVFEPLLYPALAAPNPKASACITFTGNVVHQLLLRFALRSSSITSAASFSVSYANCTTPSTAYSSLTGIVYIPV